MLLLVVLPSLVLCRVVQLLVVWPFSPVLDPPFLFNPHPPLVLVSCRTNTLSSFCFLLPLFLPFAFCYRVLDLSTVFARAPPSLVLAEAAAATVFTPAPPPLVLAEAAAATVFTRAPHSLVLADAAAATVFTMAPISLVLADAAAATVFTLAPHSLVLAEAAAATVFTRAPPSLVLAEAAEVVVFFFFLLGPPTDRHE